MKKKYLTILLIFPGKKSFYKCLSCTKTFTCKVSNVRKHINEKKKIFIRFTRFLIFTFFVLNRAAVKNDFTSPYFIILVEKEKNIILSFILGLLFFGWHLFLFWCRLDRVVEKCICWYLYTLLHFLRGITCIYKSNTYEFQYVLSDFLVEENYISGYFNV